jgi:hypothetical protein
MKKGKINRRNLIRQAGTGSLVLTLPAIPGNSDVKTYAGVRVEKPSASGGKPNILYALT